MAHAASLRRASVALFARARRAGALAPARRPPPEAVPPAHAPHVVMADFHYDLPDELIARYPAEPRDSSRLLVPRGGAAAAGGATALLAAQLERTVSDLCAERGAAGADAYADLAFSDVARLLPSGAHLVFNDSRVFAARLFGLPQGTAARAEPTEILLLSPDQRALEPAEALSAPVGAHAWRAMVRATARPGDAFLVGAATGGAPALLARVERIYSPWIEEGEADGVEAAIALAPAAGGAAAAPTLAAALAALGEVPIPPYLRRSQEARDSEAYQTVYAHPQRTGSVAAPTAGLHFTRATLDALRARGVGSSRVALHVGAGTFRPVTAARIGGHEMHSERFALAADALLAIAAAAEAGRPVVAVGTTSARALESSYWLGARALAARAAGGGGEGALAAHGAMHLAQWESYELAAAAAAAGGAALPSTAAALRAAAAVAAAGSPAELRASTSLCIAPGYAFRVVDGLLTNLHQPDSTLLLLVGALLGGAERVRALYSHALAARYRFLSYGDACLLVRQAPPSLLPPPRAAEATVDARAAAAAEPAAASVGAAPAPASASAASAASAPWWGGESGVERRRVPDGRKVLLHSCCAPCSGAMIGEMRACGFDVTIYFYNPNIHPRREYELRKAENVRYAQALGVPFVDADYDADEWFQRAKGLEFAPERGARCTMCFDMRMERTALYAHEHGFEIITTTNATSRWKDAAQVDASGLRAAARYAGVEYWFRNWQTDAMSARKYEINAQQRFYKQEYCGCSYSLRDSNLWRAKQGLPPVEIEARDSVYTDPVADSAEESREVVDGFFRDNQAFEQELKATYGKRRKDAAADADGNNW